MRFVFKILFSTLLIALTNSYENSELRCVVCRALANEIQKEVQKENSAKTVDVGGYQLDPKGNVNKKKKPLVKSEMFLSEVMDKVCDKMNDYVRATDKVTGKLVLVNLSDMTSKPSLGEVDIIQDGDLNRSLEHNCKGIVDEYEEDVFEVFGGHATNVVEDLCVKETELCEGEEDDEAKDEL